VVLLGTVWREIAVTLAGRTSRLRLRKNQAAEPRSTPGTTTRAVIQGAVSCDEPGIATAVTMTTGELVSLAVPALCDEPARDLNSQLPGCGGAVALW
jgi:hypothetical protein